MAGLLSLPSSSRGLFSAPARQVDPMLEQILMRALQQPVRPATTPDAGAVAPVMAQQAPQAPQGLLSMAPDQSQGPSAPLRQPGRNRLFTALTQGTAGLDRIDKREIDDRERARTEALRPALEAQRQTTLASLTDPTERALFLQAPSVWAENAAYRLRPRTLAPGSVERVNGATVGAAPVVEKFDDRFGTFDPLNPQAGATYSSPRGMTASEATANDRLALDETLGQGRLAVDRGQLEVQQGQLGINAQTANRPQAVTTGAGAVTNLIGPDGRVQGTIQGNPTTTVDPAAAAKAAQSRSAMAQNLRTGLEGARRYLDASGVVAQYLPWEQQDRADLSAQLDTLKGNITFEKLSDMKANSPTGASGLGALSDNEARMLASTVAALDMNMSQPELRRSFDVIDKLIAKLETAPQGASAGGGQIAVNPQTGARVQWNGSAWVPL